MTLNVDAQAGTAPAAQVVAANVVVQHARRLGSQFADRAVGVTVPILRVDQTGLHYEQRRVKGGIEFRFQNGTLRLTQRQEVLLANTLSSCEQRIWEAHEQDHVRDNQELVPRLEREIRAHRTLQDILINPRWRRRSEFDAVQRTIRETVAEIYQRLTREAVQRRDTQSEYESIQRRITERCGA